MRNLSRGSKVFLRKNGATILTCIGVAGVVGTAISTANAATKASQILEEAKKEKGEELTKTEKFKLALPSYIPPIIFGAATASCIVGANILNKKHQAALTGAYVMLDQSFKKYKDKLIELYGEDTHEEVEEALFEDERNRYTDNGKIELFYDEHSGRYFESTKFKVQQAVYFINRELIMKDYAYLNEFYELLEIEGIEDGDKVGWSTEACLQAYWQPWLDFGYSQLLTEDGKPYHKIYFFQEPMENFEDFI